MIDPVKTTGRVPTKARLQRRMVFLAGGMMLLFAILLLRLWYLQVLEGDSYLAKANANQVRDVPVAAPRGEIVDRNGKPLVESRPATAVVIQPGRLPEPGSPERAATSNRLAGALGLPTSPTPCRVGDRVIEISPLGCRVEREAAAMPFANIVVLKDATVEQASWVLEHRRELQGADVARVWVRSYPHGSVGAQLFGTVGEIRADQLGRPRFAGIQQGAIIGQSGLEYQYDRYLRGRDGAQRVQVDSLGRPRQGLRSTEPVPGRTLQLSLDLGLMKAGQAALAEGMALGAGSTGAAYVAIDPRDGSVLAMGSAPSFDPNLFAHPIPSGRYQALFGEASGNPQLNRAIQSGYPAASTFKAVTAVAALDKGEITPRTTIDDPGSIKIGNIIFRNAGNAVNGPVDLASALRVSSDVYFYRLGARLNEASGNGGALQAWARSLGFGRVTGIDLPGEVSGNVPSPDWRDTRKRKERACAARSGRPCGISDGRPWSVGDNVNLSVGQGDLLATPLQLAVAYAAIANGGRVLQPQVARDVRDAEGRVLQAVRPAPTRNVDITPTVRDAVLEGLRQAAMEPGGTSADVFSGFGRTIYGKTGTAQRTGKLDQSWYVCYVPDPRQPIVIAVTVEGGGFGAASAAPAARLIASQWLGVRKQLVTGSSTTR